MSKYNSNNPAARGYDEVYLPTTSRQVDHNGKRLENILDDTADALKARQIVTFTALEDIGVFEQGKSAEYVISRVPLNSICMFSSTMLDGEGNDWNFPETRGFVEILKGISGYTEEENGTRYTGVATTIVKFIGEKEWSYDAENQKWNKILTEADVGEVAHTNFDSVSLENNTKAVAGQVVMPAGKYILQFGGYFSQNANGYRRVHLSTAEAPLTAEPYRRRVLSQMGVDGEASYLSGTTFVTTGIPLTISLVASQGSGENLTFYGYISTVKVG